MKEKKKEGQNANTHLSPFVFASQMKMQVFLLEVWCKFMKGSTIGYAASLASSVDGGVALVVVAAIVLCGVVIILVNNRSKRK